jgi:hypothetical protein
MIVSTSFRTPRLIPEKAVFRPALALRLMPGSNGTNVTKMTYGEQLKHPNWQRVRLEVLNAGGWKCAGCLDTETTLHVHHKRYIKGHLAWEYPLDNFTVLCEPCHAMAHLVRDDLAALLAAVDPVSRGDISQDDLAALIANFIPEYLSEDLAFGRDRRQRPSNVGRLSRVIHDSALSEVDVCDLMLVFDGGQREQELVALISRARADLEAQVSRDTQGAPPGATG